MIGATIYSKNIIKTEFDLSSVIKGKLMKISGTATVTKGFDYRKTPGVNLDMVEDLEFSLDLSGREDVNNMIEFERILFVELTAILSERITPAYPMLVEDSVKKLMSTDGWLSLKSIV